MAELHFSTPEISKISCMQAECSNTVHEVQAIGYRIGISHYHKEKGHSYIQVYEEMYGCSPECARKLAHDRIERHTELEFGSVGNPAIVNPYGIATYDLVRQNAEYHKSPRAFGSLPPECCICQAQLGDDFYVPHVDCVRAGKNRNAKSYNTILAETQPDVHPEIAACSLEHALEAAHALVESVVHPYMFPNDGAPSATISKKAREEQGNAE